MLKQFNFLFVLLFACSSIHSYALTEAEKAAGFVSLFDGETLDGWHVSRTKSEEPSTFSVKDGMIYCHGEGKGSLATDNIYENYILRFDYKIEPKGNSGLYIHEYPYGRDSRVGGEVQIRDTHGQSPTNDTAGALYDVAAPTKDALNPSDQWNAYEIHMEWPQLKVKINNELVLDYNMESQDKTKYRTRFGSIAFQDHKNWVYFKNVRVKDLGKPTYHQWKHFAHNFNPTWDTSGKIDIAIDGDFVTVSGSNGKVISPFESKNFILWVDLQADADALATLNLRWKPEDPGHQVIIHNNRQANQKTGTIDEQTPDKLLMSTNDYNPFWIVAEDDTITVICDGIIASQITRAKDQSGHIVLELEKGPLFMHNPRIRVLD